ncbi:hypothetical protein X975_08749, partial [Stegodyphus mimosarum]
MHSCEIIMFLLYLATFILPIQSQYSFRKASVIPTSYPPSENLTNISIGAILPQYGFKEPSRAIRKALTEATKNVNRNKNKNVKFKFTNNYQLHAHLVEMDTSASPLTVLDVLCEKVLAENVSVIMYMTNAHAHGSVYGGNVATAQ